MSTDPRIRFARVATDLVETDPRIALVYAEITGAEFAGAEQAHPTRVVNVGIREQLLVSVGAGMALTGMRPIVHTFASFLVERSFEQIKLDFVHQGVGGVLVSYGGSFDISQGGRTHQSPGDVALIDTLPDVSIHAPGTADEVESVLRAVVPGDRLHYVRVTGSTNATGHPFSPGRFHTVRSGTGPVMVVFGGLLDAALAAAADVDATVLYSSTVRPFDHAGLRAAVGPRAEVVLVEPWLAGTSARQVAEALVDVPHRLLTLGVPRIEYRHYGTPEEHLAGHGLDAAGLTRSVRAFVGD